MNTPVIIGTDVLNREGISYMRTCAHQRITCNGIRDHETVLAVEIHDTYSTWHVQFSINTGLAGVDLNKLLSIIKKFSSSFITGTAVSAINR